MSDDTRNTMTIAMEDSYKLGAKHVIEHIETRLFYCPDTWKTGANSIIYNIVQNALADCRKIYGGIDNGKD